MIQNRVNRISTQVLVAASEVVKEMGIGLDPEVYKFCLHHELFQKNIETKIDISIPIVYKNSLINANLKAHLLIDDSLLVNIVSGFTIGPADESLMKTSLKLSDKSMGLILNFNTPHFANSFKKVLNNRNNFIENRLNG
ncbi:MAG: GxxExxY protein [Bacteroidales bacterium]|jgi:GxxExxY protein|nr:GxxExxY protein [Bacteroidales bacterium]